jgi:hypothetical protein
VPAAQKCRDLADAIGVSRRNFLRRLPAPERSEAERIVVFSLVAPPLRIEAGR